MFVLTLAIVILSVLLVLVVLIQKSKGGGLVASAQSSNQIMGAPKTATMLEKITWWGMGIIAVLCICCTLMLKHGRSEATGTAIEAIEQGAPAMPEAVAEDAPAADAAPAEAPAETPAQ